jgi:hypothetical protein
LTRFACSFDTETQPFYSASTSVRPASAAWFSPLPTRRMQTSSGCCRRRATANFQVLAPTIYSTDRICARHSDYPFHVVLDLTPSAVTDVLAASNEISGASRPSRSAFL